MHVVDVSKPSYKRGAPFITGSDEITTIIVIIVSIIVTVIVIIIVIVVVVIIIISIIIRSGRGAVRKLRGFSPPEGSCTGRVSRGHVTENDVTLDGWVGKTSERAERSGVEYRVGRVRLSTGVARAELSTGVARVGLSAGVARVEWSTGVGRVMADVKECESVTINCSYGDFQIISRRFEGLVDLWSGLMRIEKRLSG